jgi:hypothetical protein
MIGFFTGRRSAAELKADRDRSLIDSLQAEVAMLKRRMRQVEAALVEADMARRQSPTQFGLSMAEGAEMLRRRRLQGEMKRKAAVVNRIESPGMAVWANVRL